MALGFAASEAVGAGGGGVAAGGGGGTSFLQPDMNAMAKVKDSKLSFRILGFTIPPARSVAYYWSLLGYLFAFFPSSKTGLLAAPVRLCVAS
jgi:hypothetical protein